MSNSSLPLIALIGPPNAGKSSLFNKIVGSRPAVTSEIAGTTRDRQYASTSWNGATFTLVDTAGILNQTPSELEQNMAKQIKFAINEADVLVLVMDGRQSPTTLGQQELRRLRKIKKPILLAVNKLESTKSREEKLAVFQNLGIKPAFAVSAINGTGIGDILDALVEVLPKTELINEEVSEPATDSIAVSIVGKPNVGKSSIFNKILDEDRVVVSPIPGTTRASIDSQIKIGAVDYTFIDTAGLKKKEFRQEEPDIFSGFQTFKSIRKSDVSFFVIDASQEITKQDQRVAQEIFTLEKGCIILANKCDLLGKMKHEGKLGKNAKSIGQNQDDQYQTVRDYISHHFPFLWMCPLFFVSGLTGKGLSEAVDAIKPIYERRRKAIDITTIKDFLFKKLKHNPPKLLRDQKKPKVYSLHQTDVNPPRFELLVNHPAAISSQFRKYIENAIIRELDFYGTPIIFKVIGKDKK